MTMLNSLILLMWVNLSVDRRQRPDFSLAKVSVLLDQAAEGAGL